MIADALTSFKKGFVRGMGVAEEEEKKPEDDFKEVAESYKYATENELALEFKDLLGLGEVYIGVDDPTVAEIGVALNTVIDNGTGKVVYDEKITNLISFKKDREGYIKITDKVLTGRYSDFKIDQMTNVMDIKQLSPMDKNKTLIRDTYSVEKANDYIFVLVEGDGSYSNQTVIGAFKKGLLVRINNEEVQ